MQITVIIPALNEAGNIRRLISELPDGVATQVIVVDNGSTDATASEALDAGAQVVHEDRRGYGYACAAGVRAASDADILVFLDGDGSFAPSEMPLLLSPLLAGQADLALGTRMTGKIDAGAMPSHQRFGNRLVSWLMRLLYGIAVTDLGPYRAIRRDLLNRLTMQEMTYGWPTEMMLKAAKRGARIVEVPVSYRKRWSGQSKVSGTVRGSILAARRIIVVTLRHMWSK